MDLLPKIETTQIEIAEPLKEDSEDSSEEEESTVDKVVEEILPEVEKKATIPENDIFVEKKVLKVAPVKKKRVMTEEQLERLRLGREKGLAKRRASAVEKKEISELKQKKKKKDIQELREEVEAPIKTKAAKSYSSLEDIPNELLIQLQEKAIEGYDMKRKARKVKKKEAEKKEAEVSHFKSMVTNAVYPPRPAAYGEPGFFNHLF